MVSFSKLKELYPEDWPRIARLYKEKKAYTCEDCHKRYPSNSKWLHVHHIVPLSKGGDSDDSNLRLLCYKCHKKYHAHMGKQVTTSGAKFSKPFE